MIEQIKIANQRAIQKKGQTYGVEFSYEINGKKNVDITSYSLKTIKDLMNKVNSQEMQQNLRPFDSQQNLLGYSMLLAEVKQIYIFPVNEENMIYLHIVGRTATMSFFVNSNITTIKDAIELFNVDNASFEIQGKQISENNINHFLKDYVQGTEVCIRQQ